MSKIASADRSAGKSGWQESAPVAAGPAGRRRGREWRPEDEWPSGYVSAPATRNSLAASGGLPADGVPCERDQDAREKSPPSDEGERCIKCVDRIHACAAGECTGPVPIEYPADGRLQERRAKH